MVSKPSWCALPPHESLEPLPQVLAPRCDWALYRVRGGFPRPRRPSLGSGQDPGDAIVPAHAEALCRAGQQAVGAVVRSPQQNRELCRGHGVTGAGSDARFSDELMGQSAVGTLPGSFNEGRAPDCLWGESGGWLREAGSLVTGVWACGPQRDEGLQEEPGDADCGDQEERASKMPLC